MKFPKSFLVLESTRWWCNLVGKHIYVKDPIFPATSLSWLACSVRWRLPSVTPSPLLSSDRWGSSFGGSLSYCLLGLTLWKLPGRVSSPIRPEGILKALYGGDTYVEDIACYSRSENAVLRTRLCSETLLLVAALTFSFRFTNGRKARTIESGTRYGECVANAAGQLHWKSKRRTCFVLFNFISH